MTNTDRDGQCRSLPMYIMTYNADRKEQRLRRTMQIVTNIDHLRDEHSSWRTTKITTNTWLRRQCRSWRTKVMTDSVNLGGQRRSQVMQIMTITWRTAEIMTDDATRDEHNFMCVVPDFFLFFFFTGTFWTPQTLLVSDSRAGWRNCNEKSRSDVGRG